MKNITATLITILALISSGCSKKLDKDIFSKDWVKYSINNPGSYIEPPISKEKAISESIILNNKGLQLYKNKNDKEAVIAYEKAISHFPTAELYFNYGNSLSNIKDYQQATKAYEMSIHLGNHNNFAYYNLACAYSLNNSTSESAKTLVTAIEKGYKNIEYLSKDPDLKNLRESEDWEIVTNFINNGNSLSNPSDTNAKEIYRTSAGAYSVTHVLCSNGRYLEFWESNKPMLRIGTYDYNNKSTEAEKDCKSDGKVKNGPGVAAEDNVSNVSFTSCESSDTSILFLLDLKDISSTGKLIDSNKEIAQCDNNYTISNLNDLEYNY